MRQCVPKYAELFNALQGVSRKRYCDEWPHHKFTSPTDHRRRRFSPAARTHRVVFPFSSKHQARTCVCHLRYSTATPIHALPLAVLHQYMRSEKLFRFVVGGGDGGVDGGIAVHSAEERIFTRGEVEFSLTFFPMFARHSPTSNMILPLNNFPRNRHNIHTLQCCERRDFMRMRVKHIPSISVNLIQNLRFASHLLDLFRLQSVTRNTFFHCIFVSIVHILRGSTPAYSHESIVIVNSIRIFKRFKLNLE